MQCVAVTGSCICGNEQLPRGLPAHNMNLLGNIQITLNSYLIFNCQHTISSYIQLITMIVHKYLTITSLLDLPSNNKLN